MGYKIASLGFLGFCVLTATTVLAIPLISQKVRLEKIRFRVSNLSRPHLASEVAALATLELPLLNQFSPFESV